jgi:hypothetical protein
LRSSPDFAAYKKQYWEKAFYRRVKRLLLLYKSILSDTLYAGESHGVARTDGKTSFTLLRIGADAAQIERYVS